MRKKDNTDYYINRHSCFLLQYHIVFVTKYRHPVLTDKVKDVVYERIHYVADQRGFHILEINGESDHVHILMEADTTTSPAELANVLKTQTARKARKLYGETILKKYYWKPYFWSDSYFISSVSENSLPLLQYRIQVILYTLRFSCILLPFPGLPQTIYFLIHSALGLIVFEVLAALWMLLYLTAALPMLFRS